MSILSCVPNLCTLCVQHLLGTAPELPPQEGNEVQPRRIADALRGDRVCRSTVVWGDATRVTVTVSGTLGFGSVGSGTTVLLLPSPSPKTPCTLTEWCCMIQPGASTWTSLQSALNRTTWEFCKRKVLKENGLPSSPRACPSMVLSSCGRKNVPGLQARHSQRAGTHFCGAFTGHLGAGPFSQPSPGLARRRVRGMYLSPPKCTLKIRLRQLRTTMRPMDVHQSGADVCTERLQKQCYDKTPSSA